MTTATVRYDSTTKHIHLVPSDIVLCDLVYKQNSRYNKPNLINFERANIVCTHFTIIQYVLRYCLLTEFNLSQPHVWLDNNRWSVTI